MAAFFVWVQGLKAPMPQAWDYDFSRNPESQKLRTDILFKKELTFAESFLKLDQLAQVYPAPIRGIDAKQRIPANNQRNFAESD